MPEPTQTFAQLLAPLALLLGAPLPVVPASSVARTVADAFAYDAQVSLFELPRASAHVYREYVAAHLGQGRAWRVREHTLASAIKGRAIRELTAEGFAEAVTEAVDVATRTLERAFDLVDPAACARRLTERDERAKAALAACPPERRPTWRDPIAAIVHPDGLTDQGVTLTDVRRAVEHYTGTIACVEAYRDQEGRPVYLVTALGYRAGPAGP